MSGYSSWKYVHKRSQVNVMCTISRKQSPQKIALFERCQRKHFSKFWFFAAKIFDASKDKSQNDPLHLILKLIRNFDV